MSGANFTNLSENSITKLSDAIGVAVGRELAGALRVDVVATIDSQSLASAIARELAANPPQAPIVVIQNPPVAPTVDEAPAEPRGNIMLPPKEAPVPEVADIATEPGLLDRFKSWLV